MFGTRNVMKIKKLLVLEAVLPFLTRVNILAKTSNIPPPSNKNMPISSPVFLLPTPEQIFMAPFK